MRPDLRKTIELAFLGNTIKQLKEAKNACSVCLGTNPNDAVYLQLMGVIESRLGNAEAASGFFEKALAIRPGSAELHYSYAKVLTLRQMYPEAISAFRRAIALKPDYAEAFYRLGNLHLGLGDEEKAMQAYHEVLALKPDYPEALNNLGVILKDKGALTEAAKCFDRALAARPDYPAALNNFGMLFSLVGEFEESIRYYEKALALQPKYPEALNNLGVALRASGGVTRAITAFEKAIVLNPDKPEFQKNLAMALLATGRLKEGWRKYEWRWKTPQLASLLKGMTKPRWKGEAKAGRVLLIIAEQGFGDTIQFCRYAPLAADLGLRVILQVQPGLAPLMKSLEGVDQVITVGQPLPDHDVYCPMMSLPEAFKTRVETIPAKNPYLAAPAASIDDWRSRLAQEEPKGLKVGLVWAGNPRKNIVAYASADRRRSVAPALFAPLLGIDGIRFYSLQKYGPPAPEEFNLIDLMDECHDFADTAALVANLDLVISVDTAVAHLAGALGKPVWILNRFDNCWRWLQKREDSPWYPTLRLFRQPSSGDWESVIFRVAAELKQLAGSKVEMRKRQGR